MLGFFFAGFIFSNWKNCKIMSTKVQFWKNRENKSQRLLIAMNRGEFAKIKPRGIQNLQFDVSFFGHFIKPNNYSRSTTQVPRKKWRRSGYPYDVKVFSIKHLGGDVYLVSFFGRDKIRKSRESYRNIESFLRQNQCLFIGHPCNSNTKTRQPDSGYSPDLGY